MPIDGEAERMAHSLKLVSVGDAAVRIELGDEIDPFINKRIHALSKFLLNQKIKGIVSIVPSYNALTIYYDAIIYSEQELKQLLTQAMQGFVMDERDYNKKEIIHIPVLYGGEYGPDMEYVANYQRMTIDEVIERHSRPVYLIYMIGFLPGFPYLGGMDKRLETPRLSKPRAQVPAGSVGIGGKQTGVYPLESPGGWNLIGKTPIALFHPKQGALLQAGQYIRFIPITEKEYNRIAENSSYEAEKVIVYEN